MRPAHEQPESLERRLLGVEDVDDLALVHHGDAITEGDHLVELARDDENGRSLVALLHDSSMDVLDRADVQSARGLRGHDQLEFTRDLKLIVAAITFCWLPPDRFATSLKIDGVRMSNSSTRLIADSTIASRLSRRPDANGGYR